MAKTAPMSQTKQYGGDNLINRTPFAFSDFYDSYAPAFYGYIKQNLYQEKISEEIMKKAFVKIWESIGEYEPSKERIFAWAFRIVRKEVYKKKTEMVLHELFYCRQSSSQKNEELIESPVSKH